MNVGVAAHATRSMPAEDRGQSNAIALLALAVAAIATFLVSFITINRVKDRVVAAALHGQPIGVSTIVSALGVADVVVLALAAAAVLLLIWLEMTRRSFSRLLATASNGEALALLLILTAWFGHSYLNPGILLGGDTGTHIARFLEVRRGLEAGELPFWTNYQYAGAPLLWFTGPFMYVVGGALDFVLRDSVLTAKVLLFTLHMASGVLFFAWMRRLDVAPVPATLGAAVYAGSFAHLHLFLFRGVFPQAFTIVFLELIFFAADGLFRDRGRRWVNMLILSFATGGMIVNHQPHALFAAAYLALFGAVALATGFWNWRRLLWVGMAGAAGCVMSMIAVLPIVVEADWVMIEPESGFFRLQVPALARLLHLLVWRDTRTTWGVDYWAYLGLGAVIFGAAGVAGLIAGRLRQELRGPALSALACLVVCFFLWNPVVRDVLFLLFFLAMLAAIGLDWLIGGGRLSARVLLAVTILIVADLASTSVQPVARTDKGFLLDAGRYLERTAPDQRVVEISVDQSGKLNAVIGPSGGPMSYDATVQRVAGNHNMTATRLHNYLVTTAKDSERELTDTKQLSPETRTALGVFNVGRLVCASSIDNGCPPSLHDATDDKVLGPVVPITATPVLFSRTLVPFTPDPHFGKPMLWEEDFSAPASQPRIAAIDEVMRQFLDIEKPDLTTRMAAALAIQGTPPEHPPGADHPWHPVLLNYSVGLDTVRLTVETDEPGYVQLSHPWFPSMRVTVNDQAVQPLRGAIDLMVVPIQPGRSTITLRDGWTPVRRISAFISVLGVLLALGAAAIAKRWGPRTDAPIGV